MAVDLKEDARQYIRAEDTPEGLLVDVHWKFKNPYAAGVVVGRLVSVLIESFLEANPDRNRKEGLEQLLLGLEKGIDTISFKTKDYDNPDVTH